MLQNTKEKAKFLGEIWARLVFENLRNTIALSCQRKTRQFSAEHSWELLFCRVAQDRPLTHSGMSVWLTAAWRGWQKLLMETVHLLPGNRPVHLSYRNLVPLCVLCFMLVNKLHTHTHAFRFIVCVFTTVKVLLKLWARLSEALNGMWGC